MSGFSKTISVLLAFIWNQAFEKICVVNGPFRYAMEAEFDKKTKESKAT